MNVATLNCNNNVTESVVTPPQMKNILLWYDASQHKTISSGNITFLYDRSGNGGTLKHTTTANQPANAALSGKFAGRRVAYFDSFEDRFGSGDDSYVDGTVDLLDCFGEVSSLNDDPPWTIAYVDAITHAGNVSSIFLLEATAGTPEIRVKEDGSGVNDGIALTVISGTVSDLDECGGDFIAANIPRINVISSVHSSGSTVLSVRSNGSALTWDGGGTTSTVNFATFASVNKLTLGVKDGSTDEGLSYLAEFIFFNATLTAAELTQVESYLNDKWQVY